MGVLKVIDEDITIYFEYIENELDSFQNFGNVYVCTNEGGAEDEYVNLNGTQIYIIHMPYELDKKGLDVGPIMLAKAKARMGSIAKT